MSKYTPGKWTWDMIPRKKGAIPITTPREEIAYVCASSRAEANARLIAAAPEMYEILCEFLCICGYNEETLEDAEELIARIDGTDAEE